VCLPVPSTDTVLKRFWQQLKIEIPANRFVDIYAPVMRTPEMHHQVMISCALRASPARSVPSCEKASRRRTPSICRPVERAA
jgi:hypothetical protein